MYGVIIVHYENPERLKECLETERIKRKEPYWFSGFVAEGENEHHRHGVIDWLETTTKFM